MLMEFKDIVSQIDKYVKSRSSIEVESNDEVKDISFEELNVIFNYSLKTRGYLNAFSEIILDDAIICNYEILSLDKTKTTKYIAYVKDNKPVCLLSYLEYEDYKIKYTEQNYAIYEEETRHIQTRITTKNTLFIESNSNILETGILDKRNGCYTRNDYELYSADRDIVAVTINKDKCFVTNPAYFSKLERVLKDMTSVSDKVNDKINDCFSNVKESVKEYLIKRK